MVYEKPSELINELNNKKFNTINEVKNFINSSIPNEFIAVFEGRSLCKIYYKDLRTFSIKIYLNRDWNYYTGFIDNDYGVDYKWKLHLNKYPYTDINPNITFNDLKKKNIRYSKNKFQVQQQSDRFLKLKDYLWSKKYYYKSLEENEKHFNQEKNKYVSNLKYYNENIIKINNKILDLLKGN